MIRIAAVLLDLDGTLIDETPAIDTAFEAAGHAAARHAPVDAVAFARAARETAQHAWWRPDWLGEITETYGLSFWDGLSEQFAGTDRDLARLRAWLPQYRTSAWRDAFASLGCTASDIVVDRVGAAFVRARHATTLTPLPGVVDMVDALADRRLVVVTNGCAIGQRRKLWAAGLAHRFCAAIASTAVGAGKPDQAIVRAARTTAGAPTAPAVVIGDSYRHDVQAALNCALPAIWITKTTSAPTQPAVITAENAAGVCGALATLERTLGS